MGVLKVIVFKNKQKDETKDEKQTKRKKTMTIIKL